MFADLLGSQSNRKLPCYLLVWRKRGTLKQCLGWETGAYPRAIQAECTDSIQPYSHEPFYGMCVSYY